MTEAATQDMQTLEEFGSVLENIRKQASKNGEQAVKNTFKKFFAENSEVAAVRWRQYPPYFNDGDACIFHVHELEVRLANPSESFLEESDEYNEYDEGDEFRDVYDCGKVLNQTTHEKLEEIQAQLQRSPEVLEIIFGSHAEIVVTPESLTCEEYTDHY